MINQPFREPLWRTLLRNGAIALVVGTLLSRWWRGPSQWPLTVLLVLWFSLGGHLVEVGFLNGLRPLLPASRAVHIGVRVSVWFVAGIALGMGIVLTNKLIGAFPDALRLVWWSAGLAFIAVELLAHLPLQLRGRPSFYNGRG